MNIGPYWLAAVSSRNGFASRSLSVRRPSWHCARDSVADVDSLHINVRIDQHSDTPLEHWQDQLKKRRRQISPAPGDAGRKPADKPEAPGKLHIDEYASPL